jgi:hypothetical protein
MKIKTPSQNKAVIKNKTGRHKPKRRDWVKERLEAWADAAEKNDADLLGINSAPEWVLNAYIEVAKTVFPGGLPARNKWDAEFLGRFLGRLHALVKLYSGEVPLCPESQAELDALKAKIETQPPPKNFKAKAKDVETMFNASNEAIAEATAVAVDMPYEEGIKFHEGLARGMKIEPDEMTAARMFHTNTRLYLALAKSWRAVMNCRSLKHLHTILCDAVGEMSGHGKGFPTAARAERAAAAGYLKMNCAQTESTGRQRLWRLAQAALGAAKSQIDKLQIVGNY